MKSPSVTDHLHWGQMDQPDRAKGAIKEMAVKIRRTISLLNTILISKYLKGGARLSVVT